MPFIDASVGDAALLYSPETSDFMQWEYSGGDNGWRIEAFVEPVRTAPRGSLPTYASPRPGANESDSAAQASTEPPEHIDALRSGRFQPHAARPRRAPRELRRPLTAGCGDDDTRQAADFLIYDQICKFGLHVVMGRRDRDWSRSGGNPALLLISRRPMGPMRMVTPLLQGPVRSPDEVQDDHHRIGGRSASAGHGHS